MHPPTPAEKSLRFIHSLASMDTQDFRGILEIGDNDQATRSLQSYNSFIQGGPHGIGRGQTTGFPPNSLLDQGLNLPLQCVLGSIKELLREKEVGRWGSGPQTSLLPPPPPTYSMAVQLVAQALSEFVQTLLGKKMQRESTRQGRSGPPIPRPLTWDQQTPERPSPCLPQGLSTPQAPPQPSLDAPHTAIMGSGGPRWARSQMPTMKARLAAR